MGSTESKRWQPPHDAEIEGLVQNKVGNQVQQNNNRRVLGAKIVLKRKADASGEVVRYKPTFVAQGFCQGPGLDCTGNFAPTPAVATTRMLLALSALNGMELQHIDVEQAFIQATVEEEFYIELSEKHQDRGAVDKLYRYFVVSSSSFP